MTYVRPIESHSRRCMECQRVTRFRVRELAGKVPQCSGCGSRALLATNPENDEPLPVPKKSKPARKRSPKFWSRPPPSKEQRAARKLAWIKAAHMRHKVKAGGGRSFNP